MPACPTRTRKKTPASATPSSARSATWGWPPARRSTTSASTKCSSAHAPTAASKTCAPPPPWSASSAAKWRAMRNWPWWCPARAWSRSRPSARACTTSSRPQASSGANPAARCAWRWTPTAWSPASAAPAPATATSRAARAPGAAPISSAPRWPPLPQCTAISSISAHLPERKHAMPRSAPLIALPLALACLLAGCNTVKGVGKDIGEAGNAIERAAQGAPPQERPKAAHHAEIHATPWPRAPDGPRERRYRRDHSQAVFEVDQENRLWPEPVRRMALPGPGRARPIPGQPPAQPRLRAEPAALPRCRHLAGAQELWLWLQPRARALGAGAVRLSGRDRAQLCRHLLQQLLQERPAADRAARKRRGAVVPRSAGLPWLPSDHRPGAPTRRARTRRPDRVRCAAVSQILPAQRL